MVKISSKSRGQRNFERECERKYLFLDYVRWNLWEGGGGLCVIFGTRSHVIFGRGSEISWAELCPKFGSLPKHLIKTVTFDNGMEFAHHMEITKQLNVPTFFCDVYSSWQKGSIENMNGRLRRDLPRKTDLLNMCDEELEQILIGHNLTPRKVLNGLSPIESLAKLQGRDIIFLFKNGVALRY